MKSVFVFLKIFALTFLLTSCSLLFTSPKETTQAQRFSKIASQSAPVKADTHIYWDKHAIPFIEAQNNDDLAFAVGLAHAHLRLGQIEVMRYLSQGRVSELAGPIPFIKTIDHGIRLINLRASAKKSIQVMSKEGLAWMENYTAGINWYIEQMTEAPVEYRFFDIPVTPFSVEDVVTISRLVSSDLTWPFYGKFLMALEDPQGRELFELAVKKRETDSASFDNANNELLGQLIMSMSKSGSNSLALSGSRTENGAALIANDPHVGTFLPNLWILTGIKSPDYHAFGLMIPGVPVIGVGRNPDIAWGGTNMRGISSHLYDVSELPEQQIQVRTESLERRWWFDGEVEIRETSFGPILTDLPIFDEEKQTKDIALYWLGQTGSDEITAFLNASKASNWQQYRNAFAGYTVSAFNMLYADKQGNIGMVPAYGQPILKQPSKTLDLIKTTDNPVQGILKPTEQDFAYNPDNGIIASANNKPFANPQIPYGFSFANNDRHDRLIELAELSDRHSVESMKHIQQDVFSANAYKITSLWRDKIKGFQFESSQTWVDELRQWDGRYNSDSAGAVVFEVMSYYAWQDFATLPAHSEVEQRYFQALDNWKPYLLQWFNTLDNEQLVSLTQTWLKDSEDALVEFPTWGDIQRQSQAPALGAIPVLGRRFRLDDYPGSGANDTLNKNGRTFAPEQNTVFYGSVARHISDLSSPDENYFVMHGGQDGWLHNPNMADQTELWRAGEYIKIPLTMSKVKAQFNAQVTVLSP